MPIRSLAIVILFLGLNVAAHAQGLTNLGVSSYEGQNVSSVGVAGRPDITFDSVQSAIAVQPDKPLNEKDVDATVAGLKQRPGVQDVQVDLQPSVERRTGPVRARACDVCGHVSTSPAR